MLRRRELLDDGRVSAHGWAVRDGGGKRTRGRRDDEDELAESELDMSRTLGEARSVAFLF